MNARSCFRQLRRKTQPKAVISLTGEFPSSHWKETPSQWEENLYTPGWRRLTPDLLWEVVILIPGEKVSYWKQELADLPLVECEIYPELQEEIQSLQENYLLEKAVPELVLQGNPYGGLWSWSPLHQEPHSLPREEPLPRELTLSWVLSKNSNCKGFSSYVRRMRSMLQKSGASNVRYKVVTP